MTATYETEVSNIDGIGKHYAQLLRRAGIDTVPELAAHNGTQLRQRLLQVNASAHLVDSLPPESMVVRWVARARGRGLAISH